MAGAAAGGAPAGHAALQRCTATLHSSNIMPAQMTPRGVQLWLGRGRQAHLRDTLVMSNLGYFQLQAGPGAWSLHLAPGAVSTQQHVVQAVVRRSASCVAVAVGPRRSCQGVSCRPRCVPRPLAARSRALAGPLYPAPLYPAPCTLLPCTLLPYSPVPCSLSFVLRGLRLLPKNGRLHCIRWLSLAHLGWKAAGAALRHAGWEALAAQDAGCRIPFSSWRKWEFCAAGRSQELYYITPDGKASEAQDTVSMPALLDSLQGPQVFRRCALASHLSSSRAARPHRNSSRTRCSL